MTKSGQAAEAASANFTKGSSFGATLLRAAWLSILLGLAMEAILLLIAAASGAIPGLESVVASTVQKISWATIVCVGLAVGKAASAARAPLMGLLGLLAAPLAFNVARTLHQGTTKALQISAEVAAASTTVLLIAFVKGIEYGCLGIAIGYISTRHWGGLRAHVSVGLAVGILFGSVIIALTYFATPGPPPATALISQGVDEILFPVGCSLVLFSAEALGKRVASDEEEDEEDDNEPS